MSLFFCYLCLLIGSVSDKGEHGIFYYVLEKDIDQIILVVGDMFICYECIVIVCQMI
jgi:hypothetical protein